MIDKDYIETVLARFEGKSVPRGYIPCAKGNYYGTGPEKGDPLGASGVTVATGVDLGQQTLDGLRNMGLGEETLKVLLPYLGFKKSAAVEKLKETGGLTLTAAQVDEIDKAVHARYIAETASLFGPAFEEAPKQAQAVAVSLHYQFGTPRRAESPSLGLAWEAMKKGNYTQAAQYLKAVQGWSVGHRKYMERRKQEADLLLEIE
jgi:GH24 family phage-related lysozyme (muramidase)